MYDAVKTLDALQEAFERASRTNGAHDFGINEEALRDWALITATKLEVGLAEQVEHELITPSILMIGVCIGYELRRKQEEQK